MFDNEQVQKCTTCSSIIFDDDTADNCMGECGREPNTEQHYVPLSFDDDNVLRELPEPFPMDELESYVEEDNGVVNYD